MTQSPPQLIAIDHDDYMAEHVGRTADGKQFFITTPFIPALGKEEGCEFLAVYLFDLQGNILEAHIDNLGPRAKLDRESARELLRQRLAERGEIVYERISIRPFQIMRYETVFGLVPRPPESDDDGWWVEVQPGNYMAFHEPWDKGEYDT
jgi:hypothetical protein